MEATHTGDRLRGVRKVRSACSLCQNYCGLFAYVHEGKVIKLEGDPENPRSKGHLCAKGLSGYLTLYSPKRVRTPLVRTNHEKGLNIDPGWKEVSFEEAIDIVASKLRPAIESMAKLRLQNPQMDRESIDPISQKIVFSTFDHWGITANGVEKAWITALQGYRCTMSATCYCGNAVHPPSYLNTSTFEITADTEHAKYFLLIGAQAGSMVHYDTMATAKYLAQKRPGGVKVVCVDPMAGYAASKAEEWIPIRPGTDAAFILALVNLLVNEYHTYDIEFLKNKTNAPYLVRDTDGRYMREGGSNKPMIWDSATNVAKAFDDPTLSEPALEGSYRVEDVTCRPSFQLIKEFVGKYTPQLTSKITTIPVDVVRRIAKELGEAACIGETINIGGVELPYRPVSVVWYRGLSAHRHSFLSGLAAAMLPTLLGAVQVPGGLNGFPPVAEDVTPDGLLTTKAQIRPTSGPPYPPRRITRPRSVDAFELFPVAVYSAHLLPLVLDDPRKMGVDEATFISPEILFIYRDNPVKDTYSPSQVVKGLSKIPFVVSFNLELDDTANAIADVVFPDLHSLERLAEGMFLRIGEPGFWYAAKPVSSPPFEGKWNRIVSDAQILLEIAERTGFLDDVYRELNREWKLAGTSFELDVTRKYAYEDLVDRRLTVSMGPQRGLSWLMQDDGGLLSWGAKVEEKYRGAFRKARIHLYYEFMLETGRQLENLIKEIGLDWWNTSDYQAIPDWKPCASYVNRDVNKELFLVNYKVPVMAHSFGRFNPLPARLVMLRRHLDSALIHPSTARKFNISDGDEVIVENSRGTKQRAIICTTERVHPEVLATSQHRLKNGVDFNQLVTAQEDTMDFVGGAIDSCVLVKVYRPDSDANRFK